ncbi:hypothetical protein KAI37_00206 [Paenibacillus sp. S25]|nr:hypothetical protein KAI37_00206 [Paenibacillus sp. S25]
MPPFQPQKTTIPTKASFYAKVGTIASFYLKHSERLSSIQY